MSNLINIKQLVPELIAYKQNNPGKKIAFCFSGGGARGAYFGGILEALQQEINKVQNSIPLEQRIKPDIICGTSAGALAGFAYWMENICPSTQNLYALKQSNIWKDISDGNKGAKQLFENYKILAYISNSSETLDDFMDVLDALDEDWNSLKLKLELVWNDIQSVFSDVVRFDINKFNSNVQHRLETLKEDINAVGDFPKKVKDIPDWAKKVWNLIEKTHTLVPQIIGDFAEIRIDQGRDLLQSLKNLANNNVGGINALNEILQVLINLIEKFIKLDYELKILIPQSLLYIRESSAIMNNRGLQNKIENFIYSCLPNGSVESDGDKIPSRNLDKAIIKIIDERRLSNLHVPELFITATNINANRGVAFSCTTDEILEEVSNRNLWAIDLLDSRTDLLKKATNTQTTNEFIFGGKDIKDDNEEFIQKQDLWKEKQNKKDDEKESAKNAVQGRGGDEPNLNVQPGEGRGGDSNPNVKPGEGKGSIASMSGQTFKIEEMNKINVIIPHSKSNSKIETVNLGSQSAKDLNSVLLGEMKIVTKFSNPISLFTGAVLTSATIPVAFPPRQWTFYSKITQEVYKHWMVDGGVVDTRPIAIAEKAGAEFIISFELTPLLAATSELKKVHENRPKFFETITKTLVDTTILAGFYRYIEDFVSKNEEIMQSTGSKKYTLYRIAPRIYNKQKDVEDPNNIHNQDYSIGVYDFNGTYDEDRNLRMSIYDWFMKGYCDAYGLENVLNNDPIYTDYKSLPDSFMALKNADQGLKSGFYDASLQVHPL